MGENPNPFRGEWFMETESMLQAALTEFLLPPMRSHGPNVIPIFIICYGDGLFIEFWVGVPYVAPDGAKWTKKEHANTNGLGEIGFEGGPFSHGPVMACYSSQITGGSPVLRGVHRKEQDWGRWRGGSLWISHRIIDRSL